MMDANQLIGTRVGLGYIALKHESEQRKEQAKEEREREREI